MLQVKNLTKIYKPKKGVPVTALNDVSITFPETGMVFILGKSGSGKSTLLNLIGGLDNATSGEFIIKGKSSKDFSASDYDSYRNTFIGFIFQEYNVLDEFTVTENIALAMQLQGRKAEQSEIDDILRQVDLEGHGDRKPNELSGGQKQRVAIARALIKNPQIIMADEPSGALDSATGKQVFDTLKKLSKTKLVLVVSHDKEFAENYADRIIELKDGVIASDVSGDNIAATSVSSGMSIVEGSYVVIKKGHELSAEEIKLVTEQLKKVDGDVVIPLDTTKLGEIKKLAAVREDSDDKRVFVNTKQENIPVKEYTEADSKLKKSRLPLGKSLKLALSSLKVKPVRLVFTILLGFIAFALFGVADTMASYDRSVSYSRSIQNAQINTATFEKTTEMVWEESGAVKTKNYFLTADDVAAIEANAGVKLLPVYSGNSITSNGLKLNFKDSTKLNNQNHVNLYNGYSSGFAEITPEIMASMNMTMATGVLPVDDYEIAITDFIFEQFKLAGFVAYEENGDSNEIKIIESGTLNNAEEIIGYKIDLRSYGFPVPSDGPIGSTKALATIVGVIKTDFDTSKYAKYLPGTVAQDEGLTDALNAMQMQVKRDYSFATLIAINSGMMEKLLVEKEVMLSTGSSIIDLGEYGNRLSVTYRQGSNTVSVMHSNVVNFSANEVKDMTIEYEGSLAPQTLEKYQIIIPKNKKRSYPVTGVLDIQTARSARKVEYQIVGYYDGATWDNHIVISDELYNEYISVPSGDYAFAIGAMPYNNASKVNKIVNYSLQSHDGIYYSLQNEAVAIITNVDSILGTLANIFLYVAIGFAVFASLMMLNFITVSINHKKREIGVLRAVGATSGDVFGIFFNESLLITLVNYVLSLIATIVACVIINGTFSNYGLPVTVLTLGVRQVLLLLGVGLLVAFVGSFIPVWRIAKKSPIDAIQNH